MSFHQRKSHSYGDRVHRLQGEVDGSPVRWQYKALVLLAVLAGLGEATPRSQWDLSTSCLLTTTACSGDPTIQGFATDISVNAAKRSTSRSRRLPPPTTSTSTGWATTAATAPQIATITPTATLPQKQPSC